MTKILNIISDTNIGGAGNVLLNYLRAHDRESFEVSVAMPRGGLLKERVEPLGIRVYELDCLRDKSFELSAVKELSRVIREADPDIVHTHGALSGRIAARRCKKPVVFTRHSAFPPNPIFTKGLGKVFFKLINERYADRIIAVSAVCRDDLVRCGVSESRIDVVLNGVLPLVRLNDEERAARRGEYGFAPDEFLAGVVARVEPYKGQMFAVEAARILKDEGRKIRVIIAGTGSYEDEVKKRAEELELGDTVMFTGFVRDVSSLLNILDVQINASYVEATSLSLLEGMSIGLPAVASNEDGNAQIIKDGENGILWESRDSLSLARAVARVQDSRELMETLRRGALEIYGNEFTCETFARNTEAVYLKTLEAK